MLICVYCNTLSPLDVSAPAYETLASCLILMVVENPPPDYNAKGICQPKNVRGHCMRPCDRKLSEWMMTAYAPKPHSEIDSDTGDGYTTPV